MEIKTFKDFLYDLSLNMDEQDKVDLIREYSDFIFYNDEDDIIEIFGEDPYEKILNVDGKESDNSDYKYFIMDDDGRIKTFDNIDDHYNIFEIMMDNKDVYLDEYKDYLSNILNKIDNFEDLYNFKGVTLIEDLIDDFIENIDKKFLTIGGAYIKQ